MLPEDVLWKRTELPPAADREQRRSSPVAKFLRRLLPVADNGGVIGYPLRITKSSRVAAIRDGRIQATHPKPLLNRCFDANDGSSDILVRPLVRLEDRPQRLLELGDVPVG